MMIDCWKYYITFLLLFLFGSMIHAQEVYMVGTMPDTYSSKVRRIVKDQLIGFEDKKGKVVIEPQFHQAERFEKKICVVGIYQSSVSSTDGGETLSECLYGVIDKKGNWIVPCKYMRRWDDVRNSFVYEEANGTSGFYVEKGRLNQR